MEGGLKVQVSKGGGGGGQKEWNLKTKFMQAFRERKNSCNYMEYIQKYKEKTRKQVRQRSKFRT